MLVILLWSAGLSGLSYQVQESELWPAMSQLHRVETQIFEPVNKLQI